jgi:uncharacterized protein YndB with AHSA1/START domain
MAKENDHFVTDEIFAIRRSFDAPRNLMFAAFTDPEHMMRWWAPKGYNMVYCRRDLRPGGLFHYCARSPEGKAVWGQFAYKKIIAGRRIDFIHSFLDEHGNPQPVFPGWPAETMHRITFTEQQGKTTINLIIETLTGTDTIQTNFLMGFKQMKKGYTESFDQLEDHLAEISGPIQLNKIA